MKPHRNITTGVLFLLFGAGAPAYAQQDQPDRSVKAPRQEQRESDRRPQANRPPERRQRVETSEQREKWQPFRAHSWQAEHRTWQQRGGYHGFRIPDDRFRRQFGREHVFRLRSRPLVFVAGYPRFQYGDYWFELVDPWPEYWPDDWYATDDVYIVNVDDGYYLYNVNRPGTRIAVNVFVD